VAVPEQMSREELIALVAERDARIATLSTQVGISYEN
jgi:hypothetical protein